MQHRPGAPFPLGANFDGGGTSWSVVLDPCDDRGGDEGRMVGPGAALRVEARSVVLRRRPHDA